MAPAMLPAMCRPDTWGARAPLRAVRGAPRIAGRPKTAPRDGASCLRAAAGPQWSRAQYQGESPILKNKPTVDTQQTNGFDLDLVDAELPSHSAFCAGFMGTPGVHVVREGHEYRTQAPSNTSNMTRHAQWAASNVHKLCVRTRAPVRPQQASGVTGL